MSGRSAPLGKTALLLAAAVAVTGVALYGTAGLWGNQTGGVCRASAAIAARIAPLAKGEVASLQVDRAPKPLVELSFAGPEGQPVSLASFGGRTVLLNLWATWCEPCKREMPALDKVQATLGGPAFAVVAVNIDTRNLDRPKAWLRETGIERLAYYSDEKAGIFQALRRAGEVEGLPTTILVGPDGCKVGKLSGWAEWASEDGLALMRAAAPKT